VLVAGFFAFMPIDKASTVHTTILGTADRAYSWQLESTAGQVNLILIPAAAGLDLNGRLVVSNIAGAVFGGTAGAGPCGSITLPASGTLAIKFSNSNANDATANLTLFGSFTGTTAPVAGNLVFSAAAAIANGC
jgi:hypothetical protein